MCMDVKVMLICVSRQQMQTICQNTPSPGVTLRLATAVVGSERACVLALPGLLPRRRAALDGMFGVIYRTLDLLQDTVSEVDVNFSICLHQDVGIASASPY